MAEPKRAKWSIHEILATVEYAMANHAKYLIKKKNRKTSEFWAEVGGVVGHTKDETERLFKNMNHEYQMVRQQMHVSGTATTVPKLRQSEELFVAYESYYQLFYPQGGSAVPALVMTETSVQFLHDKNTLRPVSVTTMTLPAANQSDVTQQSTNPSTTTESPVIQSNVQLTSQSTVPSLTISQSNSKCLRKSAKGRVVKKHRAQNDLQTLMRLQVRQLQVERQRMQIERQMLERFDNLQAALVTPLVGIHSELTAIRMVLCHNAGLDFECTKLEQEI